MAEGIDCSELTWCTDYCIDGCDMTGPCEHQQYCRTYGKGWGFVPDPCKTETITTHITEGDEAYSDLRIFG